MPDFGDIEKEIKDHPQQADEGIQDLDKEADKQLGGKDRGAIDKGAADLEKDLGGQPPQ